MHKLKITGFRYGLQKVTMTKILREKLSLALDEAKHCTDDVLDGKIVSFELKDFASAKELAEALENIGAMVEIEDYPPFVIHD